MSVAASGRSRTVVFGGIATILLAVLVIRQYGSSISLPVPDLQSENQIKARIANLQRVVAAREAIDQAYFKTVGGYAEAMASAVAFMPKGGEPKVFAETAIREAIAAQGPVRNLVVTLGEVSRRSDGMTEVPVSIALVSGSQTALAIIVGLGLPEKGVVWDDLTVNADAKSQTVSLAGRLSALVIEAAE